MTGQNNWAGRLQPVRRLHHAVPCLLRDGLGARRVIQDKGHSGLRQAQMLGQHAQIHMPRCWRRLSLCHVGVVPRSTLARKDESHREVRFP